MEVVVVVLDVAPCSWSHRPPQDLEITVESVVSFCRAVGVAWPGTRVAIVAAHPTRASILFRSAPAGDGGDDICRRGDIRRQVLAALPALVSATPSPQPPCVAAAISRALCHANALLKLSSAKSATERGRGRVLCIQASADDGTQRIAAMNTVFAAQSLSIPIDACILSGEDSPFLQQAAFATGGVYVKHSDVRCGLLERLVCCFAPSASARSAAALPALLPTAVDLRPSCFCHGTPLAQGFACSACLSILCKFTAVCPTCGARFWLPSIETPSVSPSRSPTAAAGSGSPSPTPPPQQPQAI